MNEWIGYAIASAVAFILGLFVGRKSSHAMARFWFRVAMDEMQRHKGEEVGHDEAENP